ncbi:MAG TPA: VOC family protein [Streptosporangiaceae bacterium]|jgi:catechol 2,3-dioxygenase-like lactoylglutathione lyase family enzyme
MDIRRIVPDLHTSDPERARAFYAGLGLAPVMDHGWVVALAPPGATSPQLMLMTRDASAAVDPDVSIEVSDVDAAYAAMTQAGAPVVHEIRDEPWGVRRFFVRDPDGHVVNVLGHR